MFQLFVKLLIINVGVSVSDKVGVKFRVRVTMSKFSYK